MLNNYLFLRHGETEYHLKKKGVIYHCWANCKVPIKLSKGGERQVMAAARKLKKERIDLIYSSDIFRTRQTARIAAKALDLKIVFDKRLRDINLGIYHGRLKEEFYHDFPYPLERFEKGIPEGESWNELKKRLKNFLKDVEKKHRNKNVLIVSHGDTLWMLEGILKGLSNEEMVDKIFREKKYIKMGELRKIQ